MAAKWELSREWITRTYPRITEWKGRAAIAAKTGAGPRVEKQLDLKIERVYHFASLQLAAVSANKRLLSRIRNRCRT